MPEKDFESLLLEMFNMQGVSGEFGHHPVILRTETGSETI